VTRAASRGGWALAVLSCVAGAAPASGAVARAAGPISDAPATAATEGATAAADTPALSALRAAAPPCPAAARWCFGLHVRIAVVGGEPVASAEWLAAQVEGANRLFAVIAVGFTVHAVEPLAPRWAQVDTRDDRDALGRPFRSPGAIPVFVTGRLADVDVAGAEIRGVHWRDRRTPTDRWVILSTRAESLVLAHELGHYFGLPHSTYAVSIMNKRERAEPPWAERGFHPRERARMAERRDALLAEGALVPLAAAAATGAAAP